MLDIFVFWHNYKLFHAYNILGAGISGLVAGYTLFQEENNLIILAKDSDYGGLGDNFTIEGFRFDRFVHFSFTKDDKVYPIFVKLSAQNGFIL